MNVLCCDFVCMGFQRAAAWDMLKVYSSFVEAQERRRYVGSISWKIMSSLFIFAMTWFTSFFVWRKEGKIDYVLPVM